MQKYLGQNKQNKAKQKPNKQQKSNYLHLGLPYFHTEEHPVNNIEDSLLFLSIIILEISTLLFLFSVFIKIQIDIRNFLCQ
jgi:hypothetical protein